MPTTATEHDDATLRTIDRWKLTAAEEVDNIGGWRDADPDDRADRYWSGDAFVPRGDPPKMPDDFYSDTTCLVGEITSRYPKLDPAPLQEVYAAVSAWYEDHNADRIPPQLVLSATLEQAIMTLQAVGHDIDSRVIYEDGRDLIGRLLESTAPPRLTDDELGRLRAYLKAPVSLSELQRNPAERERRRKLKEILTYNEELRRVAGDGGKLGTPADPEAPPEPVVLSGPGEAPIVLGKEKKKLTKARYAVVKALLDVGAGGLTKDQLVKQSGHEDAVNVLKRLADSDAEWTKVIKLAGVTGGGYRIVS